VENKPQDSKVTLPMSKPLLQQELCNYPFALQISHALEQ